MRIDSIFSFRSLLLITCISQCKPREVLTQINENDPSSVINLPKKRYELIVSCGMTISRRCHSPCDGNKEVTYILSMFRLTTYLANKQINHHCHNPPTEASDSAALKN